MQPVRVLLIMEDQASKQAAIDTLRPLVEACKVHLTVAVDMDHALTELARNNCPFELVIMDLNFSDEYRENTVLSLPENMQTGHFLALTALRANKNVRCVIPINDERDVSGAVECYRDRAVQLRVRFQGQNPEFNWMPGILLFYPDFQSAA